LVVSKSLNNAVNSALARLRSDDPTVQNEGVDELIRIGAPAVPEILPLLQEAADIRAQAMYALSRIAEPGTAEAFKRGLLDEAESVRANAAVGLARIGDPDALSACVRMINDAADILHGDITPCGSALSEMGLSAVPSLLDLLMSGDQTTRLRAQRALELNASRRYGFVPGRGFPSAEAERRARDEWAANGNYDYSADRAARQSAVDKWRRWLAAQQP